MKIKTLTVFHTLQLMGSDASDTEAEAIHDWLKNSHYDDTTEIPSDVWFSKLEEISQCESASDSEFESALA